MRDLNRMKFHIKRKENGITGKKKKKKNYLLRFLIKITLVTGTLWAAMTFGFGIAIMHGNTMYPAVRDGDLIIFYKLDPYIIGDVVMFKINDEIKISRIAAKENMEVDINKEEYKVDNSEPVESVFYETEPLAGSEIKYPHIVTADSFFVMDDYRTIGMDSRAFGDIDKDRLLGKAIFILRRRGM